MKPTLYERQIQKIVDEDIINYLKGVGWGWGVFASSVEKQGTISPKQAQTLVSMYVRVKYHVKKTPTRRKTFVDGLDMDEMQEWCGNDNY